jgi:hypothetical protein
LRLQRRAAAAAISVVVALSPIGALTVAAAGIAVDDTYSIDEDTQLHVPDADNGFANILDNDTNDEGMKCVAAFDADGLEGTLDPTSLVNGVFTLTPPPDFDGQTTFTYALGTVSGSDCIAVPDAVATVTLIFTPVNDAPNAVADSFTALRDRTLDVSAPGVLGNDSDVDGDPLTAVKTSSPSHGAVALAADGGFSYTPDAGYTGPDAFAYRATDGTAQSLQRIVSINVVGVPPAPTPTPTPTPTPVPPTATPEPSPSESPEPSDSGLETEAPIPTDGSPSASPSPGPVTGPVSNEGGPPILAIGALVLLAGLLAVAAVYFVRSQRSVEDEAFETEGFETGFGDDLDDLDDLDDQGDAPR